MIEILVVIGLGVLIGRVIYLIKSRRLNNTKWLELRDEVFARLSRYHGNPDYMRVEFLITELGFFCEEIATCTYRVQAGKALFYARHATEIMIELHGLGFFEETRYEDNHQ